MSASYNAGHSVGTVVAYIVIYGGILALGVYFGNRLGRKREDGMFVRWPLGAAVALVLLLLVGQCSAPAKAEGAVGSDDVVIEQRVVAAATAFPSAFPASFIQHYDSGLHDGILETLQKAGVTIGSSDVKVSTTVVTFGVHKVLKSKAQVPSRLFMYQFSGVAGSKVIAVVCTSRTGHVFETAGTECERKAAKVFGA